MSGEIKVVEKLATDETQPDQNSLDFKIPEGLRGIGGAQRRPRSSQGLLAIPLPDTSVERRTPLDKSVITMLPDSSELLDGEAAALIDVDRIDEVQLDEAGILRFKEELCEVEMISSI